jgi:hypothetical protein
MNNTTHLSLSPSLRLSDGSRGQAEQRRHTEVKQNGTKEKRLKHQKQQNKTKRTVPAPPELHDKSPD